ncbi:glycosyltransferase family 2 protein [Microbacterium kyungheense]|uniref:N-acetylglucosaminyl-diphospho-decaprenol L-rhamnosyltransferase n=1 Tax=Microbacterium kyungheense TaxID=1263636 RepID=A0A543ERT8_9MICO|nr:glycosyltransferase family 2 protein [Microbacterium kyungheense]TQM24285.1 N-acetylglucosaminyl-diphospho-decaprenol L-rhamnosyltransferase [Microbacterium kyungheense]
MTVGGHTPPSTPFDDVEVVVVAYGAPELLRDALAPVRGFAVTVVDNSSMPEIALIAAEAGAAYWDPEANLGFGAGVNYALARRRRPGADVLLLNPDAVVSAEVVERLHRALHAEPCIATVGPVQTHPDGSRQQVAWPYPRPVQFLADAVMLGRLVPSGPRYVVGSVLLMNAAALDEVGGFDESFFLYAEETDWEYRAHLAGWRNVVVDDVTALHVGAGTSSDTDRREVYLHAGLERFLRKHHGRWGWQVARWSVVVGGIPRVLVFRGARGRAARARMELFRRGPVAVEASIRRGAQDTAS